MKNRSFSPAERDAVKTERQRLWNRHRSRGGKPDIPEILQGKAGDESGGIRDRSVSDQADRESAWRICYGEKDTSRTSDRNKSSGVINLLDLLCILSEEQAITENRGEITYGNGKRSKSDETLHHGYV